MAFLLFLDESGQDMRESPYEVLAGAAVQDQDLWNLILALQALENDLFGEYSRQFQREQKARKLLKPKTFRLARQEPPMTGAARTQLAFSCLEKGKTNTPPSRRELTALGQAKIAFCGEMLETCARFRVKLFASVVPREAPRPAGRFLRKDYAFLFERFFYFLEDRGETEMGLVVFDEKEKSQCHLLLNQMHEYFLGTTRGRQRAGKVIPEPLFVHSDLTTLIGVADLAAYLIAWGVRLPGMNHPARPELAELAQQVLDLRYRTTRQEEQNQEEFPVWSFKLIEDLRPRHQKEP